MFDASLDPKQFCCDEAVSVAKRELDALDVVFIVPRCIVSQGEVGIDEIRGQDVAEEDVVGTEQVGGWSVWQLSGFGEVEG